MLLKDIPFIDATVAVQANQRQCRVDREPGAHGVHVRTDGVGDRLRVFGAVKVANDRWAHNHPHSR